MNDIYTQTSVVIQAVNRILCQIDSDILSPTYGCAHLAYWRDKTSDFADMRRQEAMLPLALLYSNDYPSSSWKGNEKLKRAIEALLLFWCKNQYTDGSMDEWYKGERAFAAPAFSVHAAARTLVIMRNHLSADTISISEKGLDRAARWLVRHDDLFKTNHQAVCVGALAWAGEALKKSAFKDAAQKKLQSVLRVQTKEGWFPEIGRADIGYTFLTLEFILMAMDLWNDWGSIEPLRQAFDFACEWIHPDLAIGEDYGICRNPYLSHTAIILMSKFSDHAVGLRHRIEGGSLNLNGHSPFLSDDLRLLRNSYQPLLTYDYAQKTPCFVSDKNEAAISSDFTANMKIYEDAGLVKFSYRKCRGIIAALSGGLVRLFGTHEKNYFSDYGYAISTGSGYATSYIYNKNIQISNSSDGIRIACPISVVKKTIPPFWARAILHIASSTSLGSKIARKGIDVIRKKVGTPINQSSSNLSSSSSGQMLHRHISFPKDYVLVKDELIFKKPVKRSALFFLESINDDWMMLKPLALRISDLPGEVTRLEIIKRYSPGESWSLAEIEVKNRSIIDVLKLHNYNLIQYLPTRKPFIIGQELSVFLSFVFHKSPSIYNSSLFRPLYLNIFRLLHPQVYKLFNIFFMGNRFEREDLIGRFITEKEFESFIKNGLFEKIGTDYKSSYRYIPIEDAIAIGGFDENRKDYVHAGYDTMVLYRHIDKELRGVAEIERALEIGCGAGILSFLVAKKAKAVDAIDINPEAVRLGRISAILNKEKKINIFESDIYSKVVGKYDYIFSNPPFELLPKERCGMLHAFGGDSGLEVIAGILEGLDKHLSESGVAHILSNTYITYSGEDTLKGMIKKIFSDKNFNITIKKLSYYLKPEYRTKMDISFSILYFMTIKRAKSYRLKVVPLPFAARIREHSRLLLLRMRAR